MLLPYTTAEWWYLGAGGVPVVNALFNDINQYKRLHKTYLSTLTLRLSNNTHRHHEQSFTSNRNKSLSMFLLKEIITHMIIHIILLCVLECRKSKGKQILTHCLLQRRRWHLCMPQQCVCYACKKQNSVSMEKSMEKNCCKWINKQCTLHPQTHHRVAASSSGGQSQKARSWVSNTQHCQSSCGQNQHWEQLWIYKTWLQETMTSNSHLTRLSPTEGPSLERKKSNLFASCLTVWSVSGSSESCCPKDYDCLQSYL